MKDPYSNNSNKVYNGPVVTISRECGCSAKRIATKLSMILSGYTYQSTHTEAKPWHWVCKEILEKTALNLEMETSQIKDVFMGEAKQRISSTNNIQSIDPIYNIEDHEVIDAVEDAINHYIHEGNYIIVGRGAEALVKDVPKKLSVRLVAPFAWRVERIMAQSNLAKHEAQMYVEHIDQSRSLFIEHIMGNKFSMCDYDIIFNYSTLADDDIVESIVNVLKRKNII